MDLFRSADSGLWGCCLLPCIATLTGMKERFLLQTSMLLTLLCYSTYNHRNTSKATLLLLGTCVCLLLWQLYTYTEGAVWFLACCMLYMYLLWRVPTKFPYSFTFGELALVLQLYTTMLHMMIDFAITSSNEDLLGKPTVGIFLGVHVAVLGLWFLKRRQLPPLLLWSLMILLGLSYISMAVVVYIQPIQVENLFLKLIYPNWTVLCFWTVWLIASLLIVYWYRFTTDIEESHKKCTDQKVLEGDHYSACQHMKYAETDNNRDEKCQQIKYIERTKQNTTETSVTKSINLTGSDNDWLSSVVRKYFHLAILGVYIPGLMMCPDLLYVASLLIAAVLIILESTRVLKIPPVGDMLDQYLSVFLDKQDSGSLILTPIYLLVGCSAPLWFVYKQQEPPCSLPVYSGLVSIGVGDSFASVFGKKFGKHKWPDSKKSVEGTLAAVISQLLALYCLHCFNVPGAAVTIETVVCVILISLLEAFSTQIDNLIVPVFTWLLFIITDLKAVVNTRVIQ